MEVGDDEVSVKCIIKTEESGHMGKVASNVYFVVFGWF